MKKVIPIFLIIMGIIVLTYPKLSAYYYEYKEKKIMNEMELTYENEPKREVKSEVPKKKKIYAIEIGEIALYQPILEGVTKENLKTTICTINNTKPGEIGNYALAGHRSHTYGRNFNRLNELGIGDEIKIYKDSNEYIYIITEKFTVEPSEIWVLKGNKKDREITLVTCDPPINPHKRLIIKGKLK